MHEALAEAYWYILRADTFPTKVRFVLLALCIEKAELEEDATFSTGWLRDLTKISDENLNQALKFLADTGVLLNVRHARDPEESDEYTEFLYELNLKRTYPN